MFRGAMNIACQTWFGGWAFVGLIINWAGCLAIYSVCDKIEMQQELCCKFSHWVFRWFFIKSCPWIRISPPPYEKMVRLMDRDRVFLLMNHTSFWDSVLLVGIVPASIIWRYRTLMKAKLFDVSAFCESLLFGSSTSATTS